MKQKTNSLSLYELNNLVRSHIECQFADEYWVQAELSDVRANASGHCYLELIEKDKKSQSLIAKARATIWNPVYKLLKAYFEKETGQSFVSGIKVLVKVSVCFHELYGYSLNIVDIDPSYTLGDIVRRRREILEQLKEEGVLNLNKELQMPMVPQHIAVISSATAAGYEDFCNQLKHNPYGYIFYPMLFPAIMQGEKVEESVIKALNKIYQHQDFWDVVVIIRGGGATSDLSSFDSYLLAANCAQFPIPIITGIGHERDDTIIDLISHTRVKTPTAAAECIITYVHEFAELLEGYRNEIIQNTVDIIDVEKDHLKRCINKFSALVSGYQISEDARLNICMQKLKSSMQSYIQKEYNRLEQILMCYPLKLRSIQEKERYHLNMVEFRLKAYMPETILSRGYSITLKDGKVITDTSVLKIGDRLITYVSKGNMESVVEKIK